MTDDGVDQDPMRLLEEVERGAGLQAGLRLFDASAPVRVEEMLGAWRGSGVPTGSPLDGLLETYGWHGKRFDGPDEAHALVFTDDRGRFSVSPAGVPLAVLLRLGPRLRSQRAGSALRPLLRARRTRRPTARLRMVEYRGVVTGTMCYDAL
ncbi:MAG: GXWXG domain-containing protein, partial [Dermatophilaceae bacterium]